MKYVLIPESEIEQKANEIVARHATNPGETMYGNILALLAPVKIPEEVEGLAATMIGEIGLTMLALGEEIDTAYGPMQPPEIQRDVAIPYLSALLAAFADKIRRECGDRLHGIMLKKLDVDFPATGERQEFYREEFEKQFARYRAAIECKE